MLVTPAPPQHDMRRKILIAIIILLAVVLVLCVAYAAALEDALSSLPENTHGNVSANIGTHPSETERSPSAEDASDKETTGSETVSTSPNDVTPFQTDDTTPPYMAETSESTAEESTEPIQAPTTEQTTAEDNFDPDELPPVPNA